MSENSHSITLLIEQLRSDNDGTSKEAARRLWHRYVDDLLRVARANLSARVRRREDEYDVVQNMYKSFCLRQRQGGYELRDRDDLWALLVTITQNKARKASARHTRQRRDIRKELAPPEPDGAAESRDGLVGRLEGDEPGPAGAMELLEELERRLTVLDEPLRQVALWKLDGYTNQEIAGRGMMDCTERTVERKLALIRKAWTSEGDAA